ncbi:MAG: hypothetical protein ACRD1L_06910 [Terriglobales bacterium]
MNYNIDYDTSSQTTDDLGQDIAGAISSQNITAVYTGGGHIALTTTAFGTYTNYPLQVEVNDGCEPLGTCSKAPRIRDYGFTGGHN